MVTPSTGTAPERATVFSVVGDVKIVPRGRNVGVPAERGMSLSEEDWIRTGPNASITVSFDEENENVLRIEENSLVIMKLDGYIKVQLLSGDVYAVLENVSEDDVFRVMTPSVITESASSGWGASSDGSYTNVVVFNNKVFVYGINPDGSPKEDKYWVGEGHQRRTLRFEDPGSLEASSEALKSWFEEQVVAHHLERKMRQELAQKEDLSPDPALPEDAADVEAPPVRAGGPASQTMIVDGEEVNIVEYLYKQRLRRN